MPKSDDGNAALISVRQRLLGSAETF